MWQCSHCDESVDDTFNICWNCGTLNSDFKPESDDPAVPDPRKDADLEAHPDPVDTPSQPFGSGGMSRHEFAALICKTLALILFAVAAVLSVTVVVLMFSILWRAPYERSPDAQDLYIFLVAAVPGLAMVGIGVIYWMKSNWIASQMVPDDPRPITIPPFTVQDAMVVAFSTTGLFFLLEGARATVSVVYILHSYSTDDSELGFQIWPPIIQFGLAAWLILGSRGIVGAIHWCRTAGNSRPDNGPNESAA